MNAKPHKQSKKVELTAQLEEAKNLLNFPNLYLSSIFSDLKTEIDVAFVTDLTNENDPEQKQDINESWTEMIDHVNKLEKIYLDFKLNEQTRGEISRDIDAIERKFNSGINKKNAPQIKQSIQSINLKLKKLLMQNQSFIFFDKNKSDIQIEMNSHKFIIISNENWNAERLKNLLRKLQM